MSTSEDKQVTVHKSELLQTANVVDFEGQKHLRSRSRPFLIGWLVYLLAIMSLVVFYWVPAGFTMGMDFRAMYTGGYLLRTNPAHLYDLAWQKQVEDGLFGVRESVLPFAHLATEALLFLPFSLLSFNTAYSCMAILNTMLLGACFFAAKDVFSRTFEPWQPHPGLAIYIYVPIVFAIAHGQDSILLLLFYCMAWRQLSRGHMFSAGCFAALVFFKPHIALIGGLLLAARFGWRLLAGFAAGAAAMASASWAVAGTSGTVAYFAMLRQISLLEGQSVTAQNAIAVYPLTMPNLRGLFYMTIGRYLSPAHAFYAIAFLSLLFLIWTTFFIRKAAPSEAFALSILAAVLLGYNIQRSELAILILPIVLLVHLPGRWLRASIAMLFLMPVFCIFFSPKDGMPPFYLVSLPIMSTMIFAVTDKRDPAGMKVVL